MDEKTVIAADAVETERDALLAQLHGVGEECKGLKAQTARLVEQLESVGQENVDLKAQTAGLVEQLESVGQENVDLKAQTARLVEQLQSVGRENVGLKAQTAALLNQLRSVGEENAGLKAQTDAFLAQLESVAFELKHTKEINELHVRSIGRLPTPNMDGVVGESKQVPAILIAALPKSVSVYIATGLWQGLGTVPLNLQAGVFPDFAVSSPGIAILQQSGGVAHTHLSPSRANLLTIGARHRLERMVVHVRDPRQATVSFVHFVASLIDEDEKQVIEYEVPGNYLSLDLGQRIDWAIESWLPKVVRWVEGWMRAGNNPRFTTKMLYTTFEQMKLEGAAALFGRILDFYGIDRQGFPFPEPPRGHGHFNFRKGETDEWRDLVTPEQADRMNALVPDEMLRFFGWRR
jgi:hypothetical protein